MGCKKGQFAAEVWGFRGSKRGEGVKRGQGVKQGGVYIGGRTGIGYGKGGLNDGLGGFW